MATDEGEQLEEAFQTNVPPADDATKWNRPRYLRALLIMLACAVIAAVVIPVAVIFTQDEAANGEAPTNSPTVSLTLPPTESPSAAPTPTLTPEQIACHFLQLTSLSECRATAKIPFCGLEDLNSPTVGCTFASRVGDPPLTPRTIPSEIGLLTHLTELVLGNFQLTGTIPSSLSNLQNLTLLFIYDNKLTGNIPSSLSRLSRLQRLVLSDTLLSGSIPSSLARLSQLQSLDFSTNLLTGEVPSSLSNLTELQDINFAGNSLRGTISDSLCSSVANDLIIDCDDIACDCCTDASHGEC